MKKGQKHKNESKKKIGDAFRGIKLTPEHRKKLSESHKEKKHTEETKKKMSQSQKGHIVSDETRKRISASCKGKSNYWLGAKHTEETKDKIRQIRKGTTHSKETKEKISKANNGENHPMYGRKGPLSPAWKGGISAEPYCFAWSFDEFKQMIKDRDNNMCQNPMCSHKSPKLVIHHIDYDKKNCNPNNLITLCISCNLRANGSKKITRNDWQKFYANLMIYKIKNG